MILLKYLMNHKHIYNKKAENKTPVARLIHEEGWKFDKEAGFGYIFSKEDNILINSRV